MQNCTTHPVPVNDPGVLTRSHGAYGLVELMCGKAQAHRLAVTQQIKQQAMGIDEPAGKAGQGNYTRQPQENFHQPGGATDSRDQQPCNKGNSGSKHRPCRQQIKHKVELGRRLCFASVVSAGLQGAHQAICPIEEIMSTAFKNPDHVETVDFSRHSKLKVKPNSGSVHASAMQASGIVLMELAQCASNFPLVLIARPDERKYQLAAMLGLNEGENIYFGPQYWESTYVPLAIQSHPFLIGYDDRLPNGEEITTCLQTDSPFLSEKEGAPLFNADGEQSDLLKHWHQQLNNIFESQKLTDRFIAVVSQLDLITPISVQLQAQNGEVRNLVGLFTLDEVKLTNLSIEQLKVLHESNFLPACYLIVASLHQLVNLIRMRNRQGRDQIVDFRIDFNAAPPVAR